MSDAADPKVLDRDESLASAALSNLRRRLRETTMTGSLMNDLIAAAKALESEILLNNILVERLGKEKIDRLKVPIGLMADRLEEKALGVERCKELDEIDEAAINRAIERMEARLDEKDDPTAEGLSSYKPIVAPLYEYEQRINDLEKIVAAQSERIKELMDWHDYEYQSLDAKPLGWIEWVKKRRERIEEEESWNVRP